MMEKQILIVVARADLALTTIGRVVIVLYAVILVIAAALLLWETISAVYRHSRRSAHGKNSASSTNGANSAHGTHSPHHNTSTAHVSRKSKPEGRNVTD